jgi:hypothetical protein
MFSDIVITNHKGRVLGVHARKCLQVGMLKTVTCNPSTEQDDEVNLSFYKVCGKIDGS